MIKLIKDEKDLSALESQWNSIACQVTGGRIFQSFAWCSLAWRQYLSRGNNCLYVLVWTQENLDDCVIFPFYVDAEGTLRFIMDEHSDVCDCVYIRGCNHHLAYKEAIEFILADKSIRKILLGKLDPESEALNYFGTLLHQCMVMPENAYSWIEVPRSEEFAATQPQLRSKDKANVRAIRRKADKYDLRVLAHVGGDSFPEMDIDRIVEAMRRSGRRQQDFMKGSIIAFCKAIYEAGMTEIVELVDEAGNVAALNFILLMGVRRLSWIFLYVDAHASTEMYVKYFYHKGAMESFTFDFGTGGYDYKLGTFRPCMRMLFGLSYCIDRRSRAQWVLRQFVRSVKDVVKFCIGRT